MNKILKVLLVVVAVCYFIFLNISIFYLLKVRNEDINSVTDTGEFETNTGKNISNDAILADCKNYTDEKISQIIFPSAIPTAKANSDSTLSMPKSVTKNVSFVPIPGSGNTGVTVWTDIPGTDFYLSLTDYPGYYESYLEVNMKLLNGNGKGFVRLFDVTNSRGVDGSEVSTSSQTSVVLTSAKMSLWRGNNLYRIQAKSLTADYTYFESGRIKIFQNI